MRDEFLNNEWDLAKFLFSRQRSLISIPNISKSYSQYFSIEGKTFLAGQNKHKYYWKTKLKRQLQYVKINISQESRENSLALLGFSWN